MNSEQGSSIPASGPPQIPQRISTAGTVMWIAGLLLVFGGIAISFTGIGACLGIPAILIGVPLAIIGGIKQHRARSARMDYVVAQSVAASVSRHSQQLSIEGQKCRSCGRDVPLGARFCTSCGNSLESAAGG
jgi:zinc-ribbon domain